MKKIIILSIFVISFLYLRGELILPEKIQHNLDDFEILSKKGDHKAALNELVHAYVNSTDYNLKTKTSFQTKAFLGYLLMCEKIKNHPGASLSGNLAGIIDNAEKAIAYESVSSALKLTLIHSYLEMSRRVQDHVRPLYVVKARAEIDFLRENRTPLSAPLEWRKWFDMVGFDVGIARLEALDRFHQELETQITSEMWMNSASGAVQNKDLNNKEFLVETLLTKAEKSGHPDVDALRGHISFYGKLGREKDLQLADSFYKKAMNKRSAWGAMYHAYLLCDNGDFKGASKIVKKFQDHKDFALDGGKYIQACVLKESINSEEDINEVKKLFTENNLESRFFTTLSHVQLNSLNVLDVDLFVKKQTEKLGPVSNWSASNLYSVAERYLRARKKDLAQEFHELAASKGHPVSSNFCAVEALNKEEYEKVIDYLRVAEDEEYLPAIYNLGVCHLFGYGVDPNPFKAHEYLTLFLDLSKDANPEDFSEDSFFYCCGSFKSYYFTSGNSPLQTLLEELNSARSYCFMARVCNLPKAKRYYYLIASSMGSEEADEYLRENP